MTSKTFFLIVFLGFAGVCYTAKVALVPMSLGSHILFFARFGEALVKEGHEVHMILSSTVKIPGGDSTSNIIWKRFEISNHTTSLNSKRASQVHVNVALDNSTFGFIWSMLPIADLYKEAVAGECEQLLNNSQNWKIMEDEHYDFIVLDYIYPVCHIVIPFKLNIPFGFLSIPSSTMNFRVPSLPSFVPSRVLPTDLPMTFKYRLMNFLLEGYARLMASFVFPSTYLDKYYENTRGLTVMNAMSEASIWFFLEEQLVNTPQPRMPNTVDVGEVVIQEIKPLDKEWSLRIDSINRPIVIVSLGSFCNFIPEHLEAEFCKAFSAMKQFFFIWKVGELGLCEEENVYTSKWIPQKELLSNNKVKVFVTHAGLNSIIETSYYRVPVANAPSHVIYFTKLSNALQKEGHEAHVLLSSNSEVPGFVKDSKQTQIRIFNVSKESITLNSEYSSKLHIDIAFSKSQLEVFKGLGRLVSLHEEAIGAECEQLLNNTDNWMSVEREQYDFAIIDVLYPACQLAIPLKLNIPYGLYGLPIFNFLIRVPSLPSFVPNRLLALDLPMTFSQRLINFISQMLLHFFFVFGQNERYFRKYLPTRPTLDVSNSFMNASLFFFMEEQILTFSQPRMPNAVDVGDIIPQEPKPLDEKWSKIVEYNSKPIILVSLGSFCNFIPKAKKDEFCKAMSLMKEYFFIWKVEELGGCKKENIHETMWFPQNDLLANSKVKLFITHAGLNSIMEAVYFAVPIVSIPVFGDQIMNAKASESNNYGETLSLKDFVAEDLVSSIKKVINNNSYKQNAQKLSEMYRLKRAHSISIKRASYLIDHIVKHGDEKLKSSAIHLNIFQFLMLDIYLFLTLAALFTIILLFGVSTRCYRLFSKRSNKIKED
ncbi:DgyrCDS10384 [Dimorphilus gyrociliatus]|uniref:DgyrCDS10384 n=1 Tax=Dimorphilus gyrociliatus TaxID=2664684 RepID=A0A7I8W004_9ANNE|nr:DgyrCDS10384 [Dimorphilus gyrociliatus]